MPKKPTPRRSALPKREFTLYVANDTYEALQDACSASGHSRSALIDDIIRIHFDLPPV